MLQEFRVDNYKSLINVTFKPHDLNLLIGLNNSGKTNLCQALRFVANSALFSLDQCADLIAGSRIGITNYFFDKHTVDFHIKAAVPYEEENLIFEYDLTISSPITATLNATLQVESEQLVVTGEDFDDIMLLENARGKVRLLHETDYLKGHNNYLETTALRDTTMLNRLYDFETNARANYFKHYLSSWQYYDLSHSALRSSGYNPTDTVLSPDGSNLAAVIYHLKTRDERRYRSFLKCIQKFDPSIDLINFFPLANDVFMFFEDTEGHSLPAINASTGTLRFLGLTYVLFQPVLIPHQLVIVEEPENGIYVGLLKDLIEMAAQAPGSPQLIFTSHSPYFIDLFDDRLDSIFVLKRGEQHSSISQPDVEKVKARLEHYPLGEQHFREMLR
ncbi:AAA family ATPase [Candidatus Poribacteria bacterium]|nr:AAA family ATPase [Candidatus Poribacteria bacterium]